MNPVAAPVEAASQASVLIGKDGIVGLLLLVVVVVLLALVFIFKLYVDSMKARLADVQASNDKLLTANERYLEVTKTVVSARSPGNGS